MKTALVVLAVALAVVSCQAGGSSGHGYSGHGCSGSGCSGFGYKYHAGYEFKSLASGYKYYSIGGASVHKATTCGFKGFYDCDKECEDPVCKQVYHACGKTKCAATEICAAGKCFDFECKEGKKCYKGVKEECAVECAVEKVCETKKVKVCDGGDKPWRKLLGGAHATASAEAYAGAKAHASASASAKAVHSVHGGFVKVPHPHVIVKADPCRIVEKVECDPVKKCEKVCKEKEGFFCTEEKCEAELAVVECGDGYCNAGDECYQPACEKKCTFHKKWVC